MSNKYIALSNTTKKNLERIGALGETYSAYMPTVDNDLIEANNLITWLETLQNDHDQIINSENLSSQAKKAKLLFEALRTSLMSDLAAFLRNNKEQIEKKSHWSVKLLFGFLAIGAALLGISDGIDSIISLLNLIPHIPNPAILGVSILFAGISLFMTLVFDLTDIADNFGIKLWQCNTYLKLLLQQYELRKEIINNVALKYGTASGSEELAFYRRLSDLLEERLSDIKTTIDQYHSRMNRPWVLIRKRVASIMMGILEFGGGFFLGQSVPILLASTVGIALSATCWPVILTGVVLGAMAFAHYWFWGRPRLDKAVSGGLGLDEDSLKDIRDDESYDYTQNEGKKLKESIESKNAGLKEVIVLKEAVKDKHQQIKSIMTPSSYLRSRSASVGESFRYGFWHRNEDVDQDVATKSERQNTFNEGDCNFALSS